jgi:hypothetical protein
VIAEDRSRRDPQKAGKGRVDLIRRQSRSWVIAMPIDDVEQGLQLVDACQIGVQPGDFSAARPLGEACRRPRANRLTGLGCNRALWRMRDRPSASAYPSR